MSLGNQHFYLLLGFKLLWVDSEFRKTGGSGAVASQLEDKCCQTIAPMRGTPWAEFLPTKLATLCYRGKSESTFQDLSLQRKWEITLTDMWKNCSSNFKKMQPTQEAPRKLIATSWFTKHKCSNFKQKTLTNLSWYNQNPHQQSIVICHSSFHMTALCVWLKL